MKAKTIMGKDPGSIRSAIEQAMNDGFHPTLGIVFMPPECPYTEIVNIFNDHNIAVFGANTPDRFSDQEIIVEGATILLMDINPDYFRLELKPFPSGDYDTVMNIVKEVAQTGKETFDHPAFIISVSQMEVPGEAVAEGFLFAVGEDTPVMGGICGGIPFWSDHTVFNHIEQAQQGIVCLIIDQDHIELNGLAVSGWKPAGTPKTVTSSEGNWVYTIDNEPALDVLIRFTGAKVDPSNQDDLIRQIGNPHPLQVIPKKGRPVMKPPLEFNPETGAILCGGQIPEGSEIRFSLPPDFDIIESVVSSASNLKEHHLPVADALLIFSCIGRQNTLGPLIEQEINGLNEVWNIPMAGYFSLGEFGATEGGKSTFHGTTCSWVTLKEKDSN